jgi:elongation factor Ts
MPDFTAADVKRLRDATGAGMMDCKNALAESDGDFDAATEVLRRKGARDVGKREGRTAANGLVALATQGGQTGVLVELNCETDFVAKTEQFRSLAEDLAGHIARERPSDVPALLETAFGGSTVGQAVDEANAALGEKIEVRRFAVVEGSYVASYLHRTSPDLPPQIGVLVALSSRDEATGKDIAQQVAALPARYVTRTEVPADVVANEQRLAEQMAREEGKPEQAIAKIVEGKVGAYFKDFVLTEQAFIKETKRSVSSVLADAGVEVTSFARFKVGQP